jgi:hypothetical protein
VLRVGVGFCVLRVALEGYVLCFVQCMLHAMCCVLGFEQGVLCAVCCVLCGVCSVLGRVWGGLCV